MKVSFDWKLRVLFCFLWTTILSLVVSHPDMYNDSVLFKNMLTQTYICDDYTLHTVEIIREFQLADTSFDSWVELDTVFRLQVLEPLLIKPFDGEVISQAHYYYRDGDFHQVVDIYYIYDVPLLKR